MRLTAADAAAATEMMVIGIRQATPPGAALEEVTVKSTVGLCLFAHRRIAAGLLLRGAPCTALIHAYSKGAGSGKSTAVTALWTFVTPCIIL